MMKVFGLGKIEAIYLGDGANTPCFASERRKTAQAVFLCLNVKAIKNRPFGLSDLCGSITLTVRG
jgi:hypothetical protein